MHVNKWHIVFNLMPPNYKIIIKMCSLLIEHFEINCRYNSDKRPLTKAEFSDLLLKLISNGVKQEEIDLVSSKNQLISLSSVLFFVFCFLLVSHPRLSQRKEGWLKPFYCQNTLPETALWSPHELPCMH